MLGILVRLAGQAERERHLAIFLRALEIIRLAIVFLRRPRGIALQKGDSAGHSRRVRFQDRIVIALQLLLGFREFQLRRRDVAAIAGDLCFKKRNLERIRAAVALLQRNEDLIRQRESLVRLALQARGLGVEQENRRNRALRPLELALRLPEQVARVVVFFESDQARGEVVRVVADLDRVVLNARHLERPNVQPRRLRRRALLVRRARRRRHPRQLGLRRGRRRWSGATREQQATIDNRTTGTTEP